MQIPGQLSVQINSPLTEARHARVWYEDLFAKWVAPTAAPARREPVMGM
jgi:hypothetical protein